MEWVYHKNTPCEEFLELDHYRWDWKTNKAEKYMKEHMMTYNEWLSNLETIIKFHYPDSKDWENWDDWLEAFNCGMTPEQALKEFSEWD